MDDAWKKMLTDGKDAWIELEEIPGEEISVGTGEDTHVKTGENGLGKAGQCHNNSRYLKGTNIQILTGGAEGTVFALSSIHDNCLVLGASYGVFDLAETLAKVQPGDKVLLDNSDYVAVQSYYRHQVPEDLNFHAWDQFRDEAGKPTLPQRPEVLGYDYCGTGVVQNGNLQGKVIVIQSLMDESTCPWCADWYRTTVKEAKGGEQDFRLYYMDRCMHGDVSWLENNMVTNYLGAMRQALLDLSDWVERGIEPLTSTVYERQGGQILPAEEAKERKGMQPVVSLLANGSSCARIKVGEPVRFTAKAMVPEQAGRVTGVDYGFVSDNSLSFEKIEVKAFPYPGSFQEIEEDGLFGAVSEITHCYEKPGTYFASVRVKAQRDGDADEFYTQVKNLARARVIVEE